MMDRADGRGIVQMGELVSSDNIAEELHVQSNKA